MKTPFTRAMADIGLPTYIVWQHGASKPVSRTSRTITLRIIVSLSRNRPGTDLRKQLDQLINLRGIENPVRPLRAQISER